METCIIADTILRNLNILSQNFAYKEMNAK